MEFGSSVHQVEIGTQLRNQLLQIQRLEVPAALAVGDQMITQLSDALERAQRVWILQRHRTNMCPLLLNGEGRCCV